MFSRRLTPLIVRQISRAVAIGLVVASAPRSGGSTNRGSRKTVSRSVRNRATYHALDVLLVGVDVDREVEEVRHEHARRPAGLAVARLQHVQPFDDHDVGTIDDLELARHDVVRLVRVDRRVHGARAAFTSVMNSTSRRTS